MAADWILQRKYRVIYQQDIIAQLYNSFSLVKKCTFISK